MSESKMNCESGSEKPCLVPAGQGFSVMYKNRSLYSRYDPSKAVVQAVMAIDAQQQLLPGTQQQLLPGTQRKLLPSTLVICLSPCLWYGLPELTARLSTDCYVIGIELDNNLCELAKNNPLKMTIPPLLCGNESSLLPSLLSIPGFTTPSGFTLPPPGTFKRVRILTMSAGTQFYPDKYKWIANAAEQTVSQFWKNRLTLVKLGRLFSRNLFKNIARIPSSVPIQSKINSVDKPVIVVGAGESAEKTARILSDKNRASLRSSFYVLAVDAALPLLHSYCIVPDGIVAVESQFAIEQAYVGTKPMTSVLFADTSSRPSVIRRAKRDVCFFSSAYTESYFYRDLLSRSILPYSIPPLGSVGLTASYIALLLRSSPEVPVFVTGLDFSFTQGTTHARGTPHVLTRLRTSTRVKQLLDYDSSFRPGAHEVCASSAACSNNISYSNDCRMYTDTALEGYAFSFASVFSGTKNLFDVSSAGLPLGIPFCTLDELLRTCEFSNKQMAANSADGLVDQHTNQAQQECKQVHLPDKNKIRIFYKNEKKALERIKELLVNGTNAAPNMSNGKIIATENDVRAELNSLLSRREYLYLHFPDGYKCDVTNISFLKRVRAEIDFFLKDINRALSIVLFF